MSKVFVPQKVLEKLITTGGYLEANTALNGQKVLILSLTLQQEDLL